MVRADHRPFASLKRISSSSAAFTMLAVASTACDQAPTAAGRNGPPTVTVAFQASSSCTPLPSKPCSLAVVARASDADGDPLRYEWAGCASGTSPNTTCTVDRPGATEARVTVSDDHGHTAAGAIVGTGNNQSPGVQIGYISRYPGRTSYGLLGNVVDPDEGFLCGRKYCESASASGACRLTLFECTCLAGLEADVAAITAPTGSCTVTFTVKDSWGQAGTPSVTFDLANPRPPQQ